MVAEMAVQDVLHDVRRRLHAEFDTRIDPEQVEEAFAECSRRMRGARFNNYVPVLVEKGAKDRLRRAVALRARR